MLIDWKRIRQITRVQVWNRTKRASKINYFECYGHRYFKAYSTLCVYLYHYDNLYGFNRLEALCFHQNLTLLAHQYVSARLFAQGFRIFSLFLQQSRDFWKYTTWPKNDELSSNLIFWNILPIIFHLTPTWHVYDHWCEFCIHLNFDNVFSISKGLKCMKGKGLRMLAPFVLEFLPNIR